MQPCVEYLRGVVSFMNFGIMYLCDKDICGVTTGFTSKLGKLKNMSELTTF